MRFTEMNRWYWIVASGLFLVVALGCDEQGEDHSGGGSSGVPGQSSEDALDGCHLFGQDPSTTYLGEWGSCYGSDSVCSKYGTYGSKYTTNGIFNEYSKFGSDYGTYSAWNKYSTKPPIMVCDGEVVGCVTVNPYASCDGTRYHPASLCDCL